MKKTKNIPRCEVCGIELSSYFWKHCDKCFVKYSKNKFGDLLK